jgi:hypothetical protein
MRYLIAAAFFALIIPIYGQEKGPQTRPNRDTTTQPKQAAAQTPSTVNVINQQAPGEEQSGAKGNTESYLSRLLAPENLPNIGLLLAGIWGICVAMRTLRAIERQAEVMRGQLTVPYRAYLSVIEPDKPITDRSTNVNRAKFPIENTGHVRARITTIDVEIIIQAHGGKELFRRSRTEPVKPKEGEIPPEKSSSYAITVLWPSDVPNAEDTAISIAITYNTGFKDLKPDIFSFVRVFTTSTQDWSKGYWGVDVDLTQAQDEKQNAN